MKKLTPARLRAIKSLAKCGLGYHFSSSSNQDEDNLHGGIAGQLKGIGLVELCPDDIQRGSGNRAYQLSYEGLSFAESQGFRLGKVQIKRLIKGP